jgi:hypothetical protein
MAGGATPGREVVLETGRLLLRPWRVAGAVVLHELWTERDPRVPPHRRIDADGHPTVTSERGSACPKRQNQFQGIVESIRHLTTGHAGTLEASICSVSNRLSYQADGV